MSRAEPWVVIPAYNEAEVLAGVLGAVRKRYAHVVVVDDCSSDQTAARAKEAGAHVVRHPINLGQGAALQTGIDYALRHGAALIATCDADGQHDIADLDRMVELQRSSGADCVLGSRFLGDTLDMPTSRRVLLKLAVLYTRWTSGLGVSDAHNGFRLFTREGASRIRIHQNRMAHASEIVEQVRMCRLRWVEAPVTVRYTDYSIAKGQRSSAAVRIVLDLLMARLHR